MQAFKKKKIPMIKKNGFRNLATFALLGTFLLTYFMDLTGLELHQYLGAAAALIVFIHLATHWDWFRSVSLRLFSKISPRPKIYYLLDLSLLMGIAVITVTGILISTWLEIITGSYALILFIHIVSSIAVLVLLVVKLGMHWKYFVKQVKSLRISSEKKEMPLPGKPQKDLSRREALLTIGSISLVGSLGLIRAISADIFKPSPALPNPQISTASAQPQANLVQPERQELPEQPAPETPAIDSQKRQRRHGEQNQPEPSEPLQEVEPVPLPQNPTPASPSAENPPVNCVVRCPQGCAFPGKCRRYIDENNNQLCDLGECL